MFSLVYFEAHSVVYHTVSLSESSLKYSSVIQDAAIFLTFRILECSHYANSFAANMRSERVMKPSVGQDD